MTESFTAGQITAGKFHCWVTAGGVSLQEEFHCWAQIMQEGSLLGAGRVSLQEEFHCWANHSRRSFTAGQITAGGFHCRRVSLPAITSGEFPPLGHKGVILQRVFRHFRQTDKALHADRTSCSNSATWHSRTCVRSMLCVCAAHPSLSPTTAHLTTHYKPTTSSAAEIVAWNQQHIMQQTLLTEIAVNLAL